MTDWLTDWLTLSARINQNPRFWEYMRGTARHASMSLMSVVDLFDVSRCAISLMSVVARWTGREGGVTGAPQHLVSDKVDNQPLVVQIDNQPSVIKVDGQPLVIFHFQHLSCLCPPSKGNGDALTCSSYRQRHEVAWTWTQSLKLSVLVARHGLTYVFTKGRSDRVRDQLTPRNSLQ